MAECFIYRTINTNADKIRAMSDEELAQEMIFFCPTDTVFKGTETYEKPHYTGLDGRYYSTSEELVSANLEWLQQPAEEDKNGDDIRASFGDAPEDVGYQLIKE